MADPVKIQALTWNMGHTNASTEAVDDVFSQIGDPRPEIIVISTQEESAPEDETLKKKILAKLNKEPPGDQYELVITDEPQFHTTFAGAKTAKVAAKAVFTDQNRVSQAVIVKKPYKLANPHARIDHDPNNKNKSFITITGSLMKGDDYVMDVSFSGCHLDANRDQRRRAHANLLLSSEGLLDPTKKSMHDLIAKARVFRVVAGDTNQRRHLKGYNQDASQRTAVDSVGKTALAKQGYDIDAEPEMKLGTRPIQGTYGLQFRNPELKDQDIKGLEQDVTQSDPKNIKKPKTRIHDARGGDLDRIGFNSGLEVESSHPGFTLNPDYFENVGKEKKQKWLYHGADHLPVIREFQVSPPESVNLDVGRYLLRRLPDFEESIAQYRDLLSGDPDIGLLKGRAKAQMYYDSKYNEETYLRMLAGIPESDYLKADNKTDAIKIGLTHRLEQQKQMQAQRDALKEKIEAITASDSLSPEQEQFLVNVDYQLMLCQQLSDNLQEVMGIESKKFTTHDSIEFEALAQAYMQAMYTNILSGLNDKPSAMNTELEQKLNTLLSKYMAVFENEKKEDKALAILRKVLYAKDLIDREIKPPAPKAERHLDQLQVKTDRVAPGDVNGGLIHVMDKPLGIEEGFVGISIDSPAYREFVSNIITQLQDMQRKGFTLPTKQLLKDREKLGVSSSPEEARQKLRERTKFSQDPLTNQLYERYLALQGNPVFMRKFKSASPEEQIDMLLHDKVHKTHRYGTSNLNLLKLHEFRFPWEKRYENVGMGGLLFKAYERSCLVQSKDHFATRINKLMSGSKDPANKDNKAKRNKLYMIKQDGRLETARKGFFGKKYKGTGPGIRKILKTGTYQKMKGLTILLPVIAWFQHRGYIFKNSTQSTNGDAIVESISTKLAGIRGCVVQEIDAINGTYEDGSPKVATCVSWSKGCRDLSDRPMGGTTKSNTLALVDGKSNPIRMDKDDNLLIVEVDKKTDKKRYFKIDEEGKKESISQAEYEAGQAISDYRIAGLGEALIPFLSMGDRDGIGSKGQNKAIIPKIPPTGLHESQFFGIDFGKAYQGDNPVIKSLRDDFSFEDDRPTAMQFKNYSILYDNPYSEKMKGVYLLAALRGELKDPQKAAIAADYAKMNDDAFAKKLSTYPASIGDVGADRALLEREKARFEELAKINPQKEAEYRSHIGRIDEILRISTDTDAIILQQFKSRLTLLPSQLNVLENVEKLTAHRVRTTSPDGTLRLNHIAVDRENRAPWQMKFEGGQYTFTCTETDTEKLKAIQKRLQDSGLFPGKSAPSFTLTAAEFETLSRDLTEQKVAEKREERSALKLMSDDDRVHLQQRISAASKGEKPLPRITKPEPLHDVTVVPPVVHPPVPSHSQPGVQRRPDTISATRGSVVIKSDPMVVDLQGDIAYLKKRLDEDKEISRIAKIKDRGITTYPELSPHPGLKIEFEDELVVYAKQRPNEGGIQFSAPKDLSPQDFKEVAYRTSITAILAAKQPNEVFHINQKDGQKRSDLQEAFEKAKTFLIENGHIKPEHAPRLSTDPPRPKSQTLQRSR